MYLEPNNPSGVSNGSVCCILRSSFQPRSGFFFAVEYDGNDDITVSISITNILTYAYMQSTLAYTAIRSLSLVVFAHTYFHIRSAYTNAFCSSRTASTDTHSFAVLPSR